MSIIDNSCQEDSLSICVIHDLTDIVINMTMTNQLKKIREASHKTQAEVAAEMDISTENYNRLEKGKTELTLSKIKRLAEIFHREPADFISDQGNVRRVSVRQHVQAGYWAESNVWSEDDWYDVVVPDDAEFRNLSLHGAEARGPSMNKRYPDGSAVVYTDVHETGESYAVGKRYIVEVERPDGLREATVKKLWMDESGKYWLLPESTDPRHQQPIELNEGDGNIVRVVGRIVFSVQRED